MLYKNLIIGNRIKDSNGDTWTVTSVNGVVVFYDKPILDGDEIANDCFIMRMADGTYNRNMTLIKK